MTDSQILAPFLRRAIEFLNSLKIKLNDKPDEITEKLTIIIQVDRQITQRILDLRATQIHPELYKEIYDFLDSFQNQIRRLLARKVAASDILSLAKDLDRLISHLNQIIFLEERNQAIAAKTQFSRDVCHRFAQQFDQNGYYFENINQRNAFYQLVQIVEESLQLPLTADRGQASLRFRAVLDAYFPTAGIPTNSPSSNHKFWRASEDKDYFLKALKSLKNKGYLDILQGLFTVDLGCGTDNVVDYYALHSFIKNAIYIGVDLDIRNFVMRFICTRYGDHTTEDFLQKVDIVGDNFGFTDLKFKKLDGYVLADMHKLPLPGDCVGLLLVNYTYTDNYKRDLKNRGQFVGAINNNLLVHEVLRILCEGGIYLTNNVGSSIGGLGVYQKKNGALVDLSHELGTIY